MKDKNGKKIAYNSEEIKILRSKTFRGIAEAMAQQWGLIVPLAINKKEDGLKEVGIRPTIL